MDVNLRQLGCHGQEKLDSNWCPSTETGCSTVTTSWMKLIVTTQNAGHISGLGSSLVSGEGVLPNVVEKATCLMFLMPAETFAGV